MNPVEATDHELQLPREEKLEAFLLELENIPVGEVELTETVKQDDGS